MGKIVLLSLALVILVQGSLVLALNCSRVAEENIHICEEILRLNFSLEEQEVLLKQLESPYVIENEPPIKLTKYPSNNLSIVTDKFYYKDNSTLSVSIYPQNILTKISYCSQSFTKSGNVTFRAEELCNKIKAQTNDSEAEKLIFVYNQSKYALLWKLTLFVILIYVLYRVIRKYHRRENGR